MEHIFRVKIPDRLFWTSPFAARVMWLLRHRTPRGWVVSYGQLAAWAGSPGAARAVGALMARNPCPVTYPCHRVVGADGALTGFMGAQATLELKRAWLEREGVGFTPDGKVRPEYQWKG